MTVSADPARNANPPTRRLITQPTVRGYLGRRKLGPAPVTVMSRLSALRVVPSR